MPASPETYVIASGEPLGAGRFVAPDWAPAAGEIKTISKAAGYFGTSGGAVFGEINPAYQVWNPWAPSEGAWYTETLPSTGVESSRFLGFGSGGYYWGSIMTFAGAAFDTDSRRIVQYGAGHAAPNVTAPFAFDLADLKWKWLDTPLPWKGYWGMGSPPSETDRTYRFPNGEIDYDWGEVVGGKFAEFPAYDRPGIVQPIPSHGRNRLLHVPAAILGNAKGALLNAGLATGVLSGTYSYQSHIFDYDTSRWRRTQNNFPVASGDTTARGYALDPETRTAVMYGGGSIFRVIDFDTETWRAIRTASNSFSGANDRGSIHFLPIPRLLVAALPNGDTAIHFGAVAYDDVLGSSAFSITTLNVAAQSFPLTLAGSYPGTNMGIGFGYCPVDGCLYSINGSGGSNKYWKLSPPPGAVTTSEYLSGTWTLTEHTFASGALALPGSQSWVFNRLNWDRKSRSFLWFSDSSTGPVQAFRPAGV